MHQAHRANQGAEPISSQCARLLVIDDEESVAFTVSEVLRLEGFVVDTALSGNEAIALLQNSQYDLILTDLHMEGVNGISVLAELRRLSPLTIAIVLTGYASIESSIAAIRHGAYDYLIKPCMIEDLRLTIQRGLEHRRLMLAEEQAHANLEQLNRELEQRVAERTAELEKLNNDLAMANQAKDVFFATLSHELRTPLTPILGWAKLLRSASSDPAMLAQGLDAIERNAQLQTRLIDDLLDISRIVSGKLHIDIEPTDLRGVVEAAVETVSQKAETRGVALDVRLPATSVVVQCAPIRLQQIIWNLLSNAIKFTAEGGRVEVSLSCTATVACIVVTDTGEGIPPEFLPHVFGLFAQASIPSAKRHGGLGLGLAIVQRLTELHGGSVSAESDGLGKGARFTVSLPLAAFEVIELPKEHRAESLFIGGPVLIVDDSPDTLEMMSIIFSQLGCRVLTATSAEDALGIVRAEKPAMVISDIGLPEADGYELMKLIRGVPGLESIPAIALSGYAMEEDSSRALAAGFSAHIAKPIDPDELIARIQKLTSQRRPTYDEIKALDLERRPS